MVCLMERRKEFVRWEAQIHHDACGTWLFGEVFGLGVAGVHVLEAGVCELGVLVCLLFGVGGWVADEHAEALFGVGG